MTGTGKQVASARNVVARRQHGRLTVQSAGLNTCRAKGPEGLLGHAPVSNLGRPAGRALMSNPRLWAVVRTGDAPWGELSGATLAPQAHGEDFEMPNHLMTGFGKTALYLHSINTHVS